MTGLRIWFLNNQIIFNMTQDFKDEIWIPVKGWETLYHVSNFGRVKSMDRVVKWGKRKIDMPLNGKILKPIITHYGYYTINLVTNGKTYTTKIHRLVAQAFIPNIENKATVNHKNGVKIDNHVSNLEWATFNENIRHASETGLMKFTQERKNHIREKLKGGNSYMAKLILNTSTGIFYDTIGEAASSIPMKRCTLNAQLLGRNRNKTPFILA